MTGPTEEKRDAAVLLLDSRSRDCFLEPGVLLESWSLNGEACVDGLLRPSAGCHRLAHCLMWIVHGYASRCRRAFDGTGALVFALHGPRTPTTLALEMSLWFDLALQDPALIREHLRHRGCAPRPSATPRFWLEGATHEWRVRGSPILQGRAPRQKLVVLVEEHQVRVPTVNGTMPAAALKKWSAGLDALAAIDEATIAPIFATGETTPGFLACMLVLVHEQPGQRQSGRPALEASWRRQLDLIAQLAPIAGARCLPIVWHALWRLPSGMSWRDPEGRCSMRYPAVSFVVGARPLSGEIFAHKETNHGAIAAGGIERLKELES